MLRIGTDCSGIEAPVQALKQLNIPHDHIFSSDIDKFVIQSIKANYNPKIIFGDPEGPHPEGDITKRNIEDVPGIDFYVAGFPCQPFSSAGKRKGFEDHRGNVFWSCLDVIKKKQPTYFVLENVKGLLWHDKENKKDKYGRTWNTIWNEIKKLESFKYKVYWKVLNTRDYGIPQNRERIFMVGTKGKEFEWPKPVPMEKIEDYVDWIDIKIDNIKSDRYKKYLKTLPSNAVFVDLAFCGFPSYKCTQSHKYAGCLITNGRLWCTPLDRFANIKETLGLQGFPEDFNQVVSNNQMKKQLGNSMSVNVLKHIYKNLL